MSEVQQLAWRWVEALVNLLPVGYAFGAGMVSTVNPCGFAMLPAYLALYLGAQDEGFYERSVAFRTVKGLAVGLSVSAGFVLLFAIVGAGVSAGGSVLISAMPWTGLAIGVSLLILGLAMLTGRTVYAGFMGRLADRIGDPRSASFRGFFLFGVAFAAASLSCTLPIFLMVVGSALASGGFLSGLIQLVSYGLGMGLVLIVLTLGIGLFKGGSSWRASVGRCRSLSGRRWCSCCSQGPTSSTTGCSRASSSKGWLCWRRVHEGTDNPEEDRRESDQWLNGECAWSCAG